MMSTSYSHLCSSAASRSFSERHRFVCSGELDLRESMEPPSETFPGIRESAGLFTSRFCALSTLSLMILYQQITAVLFTIAHPLALIATVLWSYFAGKREGAIALPPDADEGRRGAAQGQERGPREVDVDALWG